MKLLFLVLICFTNLVLAAQKNSPPSYRVLIKNANFKFVKLETDPALDPAGITYVNSENKDEFFFNCIERDHKAECLNAVPMLKVGEAYFSSIRSKVTEPLIIDLNEVKEMKKNIRRAYECYVDTGSWGCSYPGFKGTPALIFSGGVMYLSMERSQYFMLLLPLALPFDILLAPFWFMAGTGIEVKDAVAQGQMIRMWKNLINQEKVDTQKISHKKFDRLYRSAAVISRFENN